MDLEREGVLLSVDGGVVRGTVDARAGRGVCGRLCAACPRAVLWPRLIVIFVCGVVNRVCECGVDLMHFGRFVLSVDGGAVAARRTRGLNAARVQPVRCLPSCHANVKLHWVPRAALLFE